MAPGKPLPVMTSRRARRGKRWPPGQARPQVPSGEGLPLRRDIEKMQNQVRCTYKIFKA
jgi:hypothetical protein